MLQNVTSHMKGMKFQRELTRLDSLDHVSVHQAPWDDFSPPSLNPVAVGSRLVVVRALDT